VHPVLSDVTSLHQIVMNLTTNAAQAMPSGGDVHIAVQRHHVTPLEAQANPELHEGWYCLLSVRDSGSGMDAATLARAREPFFTTKGQGVGTGLGLSVVHGIMQAHGGALDIESAVGAGTLVRCYFPALEAQPAVAVAAAANVASPRGSNEHVLFVDDEPSLRRVGERRLAQLGYRVTSAASPADALALLQATPSAFALLVTDYSMPDMNGLELARAVTQHHALPVILLTGYIDILDPAVLHAAGIRRVLQKPSTQDELARAMREVLTERATSA
jgi:CheY-like chemotaxis protein